MNINDMEDNGDNNSMIPEDWVSSCMIYDISVKIQDSNDDDRSNDNDKSENVSSSSSLSIIKHVSSNHIQCEWTIQLLSMEEEAMALVQPVSPISTDFDPYFCYRMVSTTSQAPTIEATFHYKKQKDDDDTEDDEEDFFAVWVIHSVDISCTRLPEPWPTQAQRSWEQWLQSNIQTLLNDEHENPMSYTICEFILHRSLDYFCVTKKNNNNATDNSHDGNIDNDNLYSNVIICMDYPLTEDYIATQQNQQQTLEIYRSQNVVNECSLLWNNTTPLEQKVRKMIHTHYQDWVQITCPICFDEISASNATSILPCLHYFCHECITTYAKTIVQDIRQQPTSSKHTKNPFICPIPSCRHPIKIFKCIKTLLDNKDDMDIVRCWYKNLKHPPCDMLVVCPRTKQCGVRGQMRKSSHESSMVYCDACGGTWCELCLQRYNTSSTTNGAEHNAQCDQFPVLRLCDRYRDVVNKCKDTSNNNNNDNDDDDNHNNNSGNNSNNHENDNNTTPKSTGDTNAEIERNSKIKTACETKWPWLREYAAARYVEDSIINWVKNNASMCPGCRTGIERLEGCFHMNCTVCGTHFCYECGKELFPPFYGTHHCWLEDDTMAY